MIFTIHFGVYPFFFGNSHESFLLMNSEKNVRARELMVEPTHVFSKNHAQVKFSDHFPQGSGMKMKNSWNHNLVALKTSAKWSSKKKTWQHFCKVLKGPKLFQHFSFEAKKNHDCFETSARWWLRFNPSEKICASQIGFDLPRSDL